MERVKVHFQKDYEELLAEVIDKVGKEPKKEMFERKCNLSRNYNFLNTYRLNGYKQFEDKQITTKRFSQTDRASIDEPAQIHKQTTCYVFGQSSAAKSVQMQKTYVNLGYNRYLINKDLPVSFNRTGNFSLNSIDDVDRITFNVNNVTFPVLTKSVQTQKKSLPITQLGGKIQTKNPVSKAFKFTFRKKKGQEKTHSLEINNRLNDKSRQKSSNLDKSELSPEQDSGKKRKLAVNFGQIEKRLQINSKDYLNQVAFSSNYEKKLLEIQESIIYKRRIQKLKIGKSKKQANEKDRIDAWKHQLTHQNPADQVYDVFDHAKNKFLF